MTYLSILRTRSSLPSATMRFRATNRKRTSAVTKKVLIRIRSRKVSPLSSFSWGSWWGPFDYRCHPAKRSWSGQDLYKITLLTLMRWWTRKGALTHQNQSKNKDLSRVTPLCKVFFPWFPPIRWKSKPVSYSWFFSQEGPQVNKPEMHREGPCTLTCQMR